MIGNQLRTFPTAAWVLFGGVFINRFGTFVTPFLVIYLTRLGYSVAQLKQFLRVTQGMVLEGLDGREASGLERLAQIFRPQAELAACRTT